MGAYSPAPVATAQLSKEIEDKIIKPTLEAMAKEGRSFKGVLYAGIMVTDRGPLVLEFNARFGDPETQVILPRLKTDLVDIILAVSDEKLKDINIEWKEEACTSVVMASGGYPGDYEKGFTITGLHDVPEDVPYRRKILFCGLAPKP
jgi:phosphoribosylamine--glycine ligase